VQFVGMIAVFIGIALCWWKTIWVLYLFVACIPLISGIQELGFMKSVPLVGFFFSIIYISWFTKFFFWRRKSLISGSIISKLIDVLTGVVFLSIIASLCVYPLDYSLYRLQYASIMGQFDPFWFMEAGYIVLQGMFLYRVFELELKDKKKSEFIIPIIYCHALIVLIFSFQEIIGKILSKTGLFYVSSPFQDVHSYAGYILILFFYFSYILVQKRRYMKINFLFALSFLLCLYWSGSFAALLSALVVGVVWGIIVLKRQKKIIFITICMIGIGGALYLMPQVEANNVLTQKYAARLDYTKVFKNNTVVERFKLCNQAWGIIKEFPLTGSGIGSFFKISNYYSKDKANSGELRNAHNYYLQFAAESGIPALSLFLLILFFTFRAGLQATNRTHSKGLLLGLSAYLLSMLSGHHLILSTHQFLFWFILFAIIYPINSDLEKKTPGVETKYLSKILYLLVFMVIAGHALNLFYLKKEVKGLYEYGLYQSQEVNKVEMRWADKDSRKKNNAETDYFGFSMYAEPENLSSGILEMKIYVNDKLIDLVKWNKKDTKHLNYHIPGIKGQSLTIRTRASDSYNPYKLGLSKNIRENRNQSVAIKDITFFQDANYKK